MDEKILLGRGRQILEIPQDSWKKHLTQIPEHSQERLAFMTDAHQRVRYFVVKELVDRQMPLEPEYIAEKLKLPLESVQQILEELESKLFFLARNEQNAVAWAYPLTVEPTPHHLKFSSGEQLYGA
ncbi:MAG TPA: hypothetical protein VKF38_08315 [Anaerolineaceae bacterium]|nr:hypothetical protein [Anaerolineaceae bacterium]